MMADPTEVTILDATLRDSGYAIHFQFSARDTRNICAGLERAGVRRIEVGHGLGLGASSVRHGVALEADAEYLRAAASSLSKALFGAFLIPGIGTLDDLRLAASLGMNFVRIGCDITSIGNARSFADEARGLGLEVWLNPMKSYAVSAGTYGDIAADVGAWQSVDVLCLVDSAGCMLPEDVKQYTRAARQQCDLHLGFHGHNNLGLATANCLAAVVEGARFVDGTLRGIGRSAGNAQTEILAHVLRQSGYRTTVDPVSLMAVLSSYLEPLLLQPQGIPPMEVLYGMTKFHSSHLPRFRRVLSRYDIDIKRLITAVCEIDCVNPSDELIESIARDLGRTEGVEHHA